MHEYASHISHVALFQVHSYVSLLNPRKGNIDIVRKKVNKRQFQEQFSCHPKFLSTELNTDEAPQNKAVTGYLISKHKHNFFHQRMCWAVLRRPTVKQYCWGVQKHHWTELNAVWLDPVKAAFLETAKSKKQDKEPLLSPSTCKLCLYSILVSCVAVVVWSH